MIRVLIFKLKTWYAKAKVEYAESKIMQKVSFKTPWYEFPMLETSKRKIKITFDGKTYKEERKKTKDKEVPKE